MKLKKKASVLALVLFACYLLLVFYIVFFARRRAGLKYLPDKYLLNLIPVEKNFNSFLNLQPQNLKESWNFYSNLLGNILLFFPLPFFLFSIFNIKTFRMVATAALLSSIAIELLQFLFKIGVADIDDILLNFIGAATGFWTIRLIIHFVPYHDNY